MPREEEEEVVEERERENVCDIAKLTVDSKALYNYKEDDISRVYKTH